MKRRKGLKPDYLGRGIKMYDIWADINLTCDDCEEQETFNDAIHRTMTELRKGLIQQARDAGWKVSKYEFGPCLCPKCNPRNKKVE